MSRQIHMATFGDDFSETTSCAARLYHKTHADVLSVRFIIMTSMYYIKLVLKNST